MVDKKSVEKASRPPKPSQPKPASRPEAPGGVEAHIGAKLKAMYDEVVAQPIPDRLLELLNRLDDKAEDK
jgi:Anti-sigma factor NepR